MSFKTNILLAGAAVAAICVAQPASAQYYYAQAYGQQYVYPYVVVQQPYAPVARSYPYIIQRPQAYAPPARRKKARRDSVAREIGRAHV